MAGGMARGAKHSPSRFGLTFARILREDSVYLQ
jgi:hypothetical protein